MKLHENKKLYKDAIRATAERMQLQPEYVEKDYWVCYALFLIFQSELGNDSVFKGGTSLSKCFGLIDRFSEDIDLAVLRRENESDSQLKSKLKALSSIVGTILPEIMLDGITRKRGMIRKTAHSFNKNFADSYGQVRDVIIVESSWLGFPEPYHHTRMISYVGQLFLDTNQPELAREYHLLPFEVNVLDPRRTMCEKIMSLVRFSYSERPIEELKNKVRHVYDLHQLLQHKTFSDFLKSLEFEGMLIRVAQDDLFSFKNNNDWLMAHPSKALFFNELDLVWTEIKKTYSGEFKNLVYGVLPSNDLILQSLFVFRERLETVVWK